MSVAAHELDSGKTYRLGNGEEFTVESVDLEPKRLELNRKPRYYYYTTDGRQVVTIAGEMYTEMPTRPPRLMQLRPGGQTYGQGGRRRKSRKARRAQKKRTRRSRR